MTNRYCTRFFYEVIFLSLLTSIIGCAPVSRITTNKNSDYEREPRKMFVISHVGTEFGEQFGSSFQTKFVTTAKECGVEVEVSTRRAS